MFHNSMTKNNYVTQAGDNLMIEISDNFNCYK